MKMSPSRIAALSALVGALLGEKAARLLTEILTLIA